MGLPYAADQVVAAGANGMRIVSVLSGGEMTGHYIAAMFLDSLEPLPDILASLGADEQFVANSMASGAKLESRTLFRKV